MLTEKKPDKTGKNAQGRWAETKLFFIRFAGMALIVYLIFGVVFGIGAMKNDDMKPKISAGDLLVFYRFSWDCHIGDVLIYKKSGERFVGRVVAQGGDVVSITQDHQLSVNGNAVAESDIYYETGEYEGGIPFPISVPEDSFFLLSDYREGGKDSRLLGPVRKDEIIGKVITIIRRTGI